MGKKRARQMSMHGLSLDAALRAAMQVKPPPKGKAKKRGKPAKRKK